jgi:prolyl-tRNA synthetase
MHKMYAEYMANVLAIPVIMGEKTPEERFAGADHTYTVEQIMQDGKALQAGTSHDLGQHFAKSFGIQYLGTDGKLTHAWTTSWGTSTRMMGGLFMTHSDDDGLILPPAVAPYQIVIIPITREENVDSLNKFANEIGDKLKESGIRVLVDDSDARAPDKMWKWIKRGVPLRVEIGSREMENNSVTITRRDLGKESKQTVSVDELLKTAPDLMKQMQREMYERALARQNAQIHDVETLAALEDALERGTTGFFRIKYDLTLNAEFDELIEKYKISRRCLDTNDPSFVYVAKSY